MSVFRPEIHDCHAITRIQKAISLHVQCGMSVTKNCLLFALRPVGAYYLQQYFWANLPSKCHEFPSPKKICQAHILTPWSSKGSQLRSFLQIAQRLGLQWGYHWEPKLELRRNTTLPLLNQHGTMEPNKARYWQIQRILKLLQQLWYSQTSWNRSSWQPTCHLPPCSWKAPRQGCIWDPNPERLILLKSCEHPSDVWICWDWFCAGLFNLIDYSSPQRGWNTTESVSYNAILNHMIYIDIRHYYLRLLASLRISLRCLVSVSRALLWRSCSCFSACFPWQVPQEARVALLICSGNCFKSPQVRERFGQEIGEQVLRKKASWLL